MHKLDRKRLLLSIGEAARVLGISTRLLWQLSNEGKIPSLKVGRRRLYSVQTLRRWIRQQEAGTEKPTDDAD